MSLEKFKAKNFDTPMSEFFYLLPYFSIDSLFNEKERDDIPSDLLVALYRHGENSLEMLFSFMEVLGKLLWAASTDERGVIDNHDAGDAAYMTRFLSDLSKSIFNIKEHVTKELARRNILHEFC